MNSRTTARSFRRAMIILPLAVIAVAFYGCQPPPPQYASQRATGTGVAPAHMLGAGVATNPNPTPMPPAPMPPDTSWSNQVVSARGIGVPNPNMPANRGDAMARRAAEVDAKRNLLETIKGVEIDSNTTVENFMVQNDTIRTQVQGYLRGARVISNTKQANGSFEAVVELNLNGLPTAAPQLAVAPPPPPPPPSTGGGQIVGGRGSQAQARAMALRAARLDAQRRLVENIYGTYVQSQTSMTNFVLDEDYVRTMSQGVVRNANVENESYNPNTGEAQVTLYLDGVYVGQLVNQMQQRRP